jgi:hypothetical protein
VSEISIAELFPIGARVVVPYIINDNGNTELGTISSHMLFQGNCVTGVCIRLDSGRVLRFEDSTFADYLERIV